jgi:hypothetical protein
MQHHRQRDDEQDRPAEPARQRSRGKRQGKQDDEQRAGHRQQQRDHRCGRRSPPRNVMVAPEFGLHHHRPDAAGQVLAELTDEEDPGRDGQPERGAQVGQDGPPDHPGERDVDHRRQHGQHQPAGIEFTYGCPDITPFRRHRPDRERDQQGAEAESEQPAPADRNRLTS